MKKLLTHTENARDHLANERTFLAWIRTSISIIIFGFVVAKFGITLREFFLIQKHVIKDSGFSLNIGLGFMITGIILSVLSLFRYRNTMHRIEAEQFKPGSAIIILVTIMTAFFGAIMIINLILTSQHM